MGWGENNGDFDDGTGSKLSKNSRRSVDAAV